MVPTEVHDAYLNVYSSNVAAGTCSETVKAPYFCTNFSVSNNHSDRDQFHSAYGGGGFDQCGGVKCVWRNTRNISWLFTTVGLTGRNLYFPKKSKMLVEGRPSGVIIYNQLSTWSRLLNSFFSQWSSFSDSILDLVSTT